MIRFALLVSLFSALVLFSGCDGLIGAGMDAKVPSDMSLPTNSKILDVNIEVLAADLTNNLQTNYVIQQGAEVMTLEEGTSILVKDLFSGMSEEEKSTLLGMLSDGDKALRVSFYDSNTSELVGRCAIRGSQDIVITSKRATLKCVVEVK